LPLASCGKGAEAKPTAANPTSAPAPELLPVKATPAQARELQRSVRVVGTLAGLESATLSNRVTGIVEQIYADMGDRVAPGTKLLQIDPKRFQYSLNESKAMLTATLARLGLNEIPDKFDVNDTALVKRASTELQNAKSKLDRQTPLYEKGMIKEYEYLDAIAAKKMAEDSLDSARDEARSLLEQSRQNQAQIAIRQKDLSDAVILAPDGSTAGAQGAPAITSYAVSSRKVSTGEYLREGTVVFTLVADSTLKLQARVPERYLGSIKKGATVKFHVEAYPGETFEATVSRIDPAVDQANRTFMLEALVENDARYGGKLRPGSFVSQGEVLTKKEANRVMVPLEAVTSFVGVMKVYVLDIQPDGGKRVRSVEVTTGQQEGQWIEILQPADAKNPIKPGDLVVYEGTRKLVEGSLVRLQTDEKQEAAEKKQEASSKKQEVFGSTSNQQVRNPS
jgi:RND family efflux transporter MFP subunit